MLGPLLSAGASLIGGLLGKSSQDRANEIAQANAAENIRLQREFAQNAIQWKVADAAKAGVHPLYALGASTTSFSPVSVGVSGANPLGESIRSMGQDISRGIMQEQSAPARMAATRLLELQLEGAQLDNDIKRTAIASKLQTLAPQLGPPLPVDVPLPRPDPRTGQMDDYPQDDPSKQKPLQFFGRRWLNDPATSTPSDVQDTLLGEEGPLAWLAGVPQIAGSVWRNIVHPQGYIRGMYSDRHDWYQRLYESWLQRRNLERSRSYNPFGIRQRSSNY